MSTIGPILYLPWGFALFTVIAVILFMIASEVTWRLMKHLPEDEEVYDPDAPNHFEIEGDTESAKKEAAK